MSGDPHLKGIRAFKRNHRNLTMVTDTCKGWDSVIVEVNPDQKTGKTFLLDDLANNNRTPLDITPWIVNGSNIIRCIQLSGDADVFLLHASSTPSSIKISPPELLYPSEFAYNVESDDLGRPGSDTGNPPQLPYPSIHEMEALDFATALDQQLYGNRVVES
ncbi:hypothetical protein EDD18DRAFT_1102038 [Armillaria luteobubalina]|uniref:Uncharacterized protein n=1 Tax=Armillaria luteobubalina TaxID=153913 RepID=A0AA39USF6_9AGAR|nr:hypothetical protein EDD18DRAFT_1102038 [Armillaria luteobubalina]